MKVEKVGELNDKHEIVGVAGSTATKLILSVRSSEGPSKTIHAKLTIGKNVVNVLDHCISISE